MKKEKIKHWEHKDIVDYLVSCFEYEKDGLLLNCAADLTRRHSLRYSLDFKNIENSNGFGGTVNYNKKKREFDFIEYSDKRNWSVRVSVKNPAIYCPANPKFPY